MKTAYQVRAGKAVTNYLASASMIGLSIAVGLAVSSALVAALWAPMTVVLSGLF
ncbi:MAG: hypothetical protein SCI25_06895 [Desulfuromonadales bacterium]|nr:hypothetical protein [Desulfuromonadales bacterium]MDW7756099.1 hypothetical protein [Desulfuromonadales bacterium]